MEPEANILLLLQYGTKPLEVVPITTIYYFFWIQYSKEMKTPFSTLVPPYAYSREKRWWCFWQVIVVMASSWCHHLQPKQNMFLLLPLLVVLP